MRLLLAVVTCTALLAAAEQRNDDQNGQRNLADGEWDRDLPMFVLAGCGLLLASGSGIGGGGILVPIFILVGRFSTKYATDTKPSAVSKAVW